jgi:hypothetical protein
MLYTTNLNQPKPQNDKIANTNSNRTVIILLLAIIISGAILGFLVARQNNENNSSSTETEPQANTPIDAPMSMGIRPGDVPVPDIIITQEQLLNNADMNSCWTIIDGVVYDITLSIVLNSGLLEDMTEICGKDSTIRLQLTTNEKLPFEGEGLFELYSRPMGRPSP